jgi:class 3 adenylate cyclase
LNYTPELLDTVNITLKAEHLKLAESLAQTSHAVWVKQQQAQGWVYGTEINAAQRQHPYLVPYHQLPDPERQHQALAAQTMLKTLLAMGYALEAKSVNSPASATENSELASILQGLQTPSELTLPFLLDLRRETVRLKHRTPEIYRALGNSILQLGEPLIAYDVLIEGLKEWSGDLRLQQLLALSLARSGSTVAANSLLVKLAQAGHQDEETLGLLARTHKDLGLSATDPQVRNHHLQLATARYQQAYQLTGSIWTGINAATMTMVMGQTSQAQAIARSVRAQCLAIQPDSMQTSGDYWLLATLGEAALILSEWAEAEDLYRRAVEVGQGRFGDLSSSCRNAMLLAQYLQGDTEQVKRWFQIPRVVVFCGHMIDRPGRAAPRFPSPLEPAVYAEICDRLLKLDARLGYASAACGSDILFLEAVQALKGELHIVLPYNQEQFIQDSVNVMPEGNWGDRFERVVKQATEVMVASSQKLRENDVVYEYSNRLLHGLAKMRAEQLGTELVPLTVWDGKPGDGPGGTASTVAQWQQWSEHVEVIDLQALLQQTAVSLPHSPISANSAAPAAIAPPNLSFPDAERQIRALLFADVVNYSKLSEGQYLPFVQHFLGAIADLAAQAAYRPLMRNTWGDAIYFVFATVRQAGRFALDLCDLVQSIDWQSKGLPEDLNLRIALHAGPVDRNIDPITGQVNYIGTHVNHTARIEPITPPGKVYASQAFAAIASSEGLRDFSCHYVGQMPWAKRYGTFPTYHVHGDRGSL